MFQSGGIGSDQEQFGAPARAQTRRGHWKTKVPAIACVSKCDAIARERRSPMASRSRVPTEDSPCGLRSLHAGCFAFRQQAIVSFVVSETGNALNIIVLNKKEVHPKLADEAVRVVSASHWHPATAFGEKISYRMAQAITFQVTKE